MEGDKKKAKGKIIVKRPTEKAIESFKMSEQERMPLWLISAQQESGALSTFGLQP